MDINSQIREGIRLLEGLEDGLLSSSDCYNIFDTLDDVLVSLIIKYLRQKYPPTQPDAAGVMGRIVELSSTYPKVVEKVKSGDADPITEWFEDSYTYRDYYSDPEEFISLVVNKLEG